MSTEQTSGVAETHRRWPTTSAQLVEIQTGLAAASPDPWLPPGADELAIGGCFVCFPRGVTGPGEPGDRCVAAAAVVRSGRIVASCVREGAASASYTTGLLALREGPALEAAVRGLAVSPDVLLVNATGIDHPRGAGLALHLGAVLDLPTVGVTHRPLVARGEWPADETGACSPLWLNRRLVGQWVRTRAGARPLAVDAGWRTTPDQAAELVLLSAGGQRTPAPIREARRLARTTRAEAWPS